MNKAECRAEALKYTNKQDFKKHSSVAYYTVLGNRLFNQLCSHFTDVSEPVSYTYEECFDEALKFDSETDFYKKSRSKYLYATRKGWIYKLLSHINTSKHINIIPCQKNNKKQTVFDKHEEKINNVLSDTLSDMETICCDTASMYSNRISFSENSPVIYKYAEKNGFLDSICKHMDEQPQSIDTICIIPSDELTVCYHEALKYNTRDKFRDKKPSMYNYLLKNNMLEYVCGHMDNLKFNK